MKLGGETRSLGLSSQFNTKISERGVTNPPPSPHKGRAGHTAADKNGKTGVARVLKKIDFFCRETTPEEEEKEEEGPKGWASMKQVWGKQMIDTLQLVTFLGNCS